MNSTGRNDPCPCGSGKKHKHCCLRSGKRNVRSAQSPELEQIWSHYNAGRLPQAESLCRAALLKSPDNPDLLHTLGMLALRGNRAASAVDLFRRAIGFDPGNARYFLDLGRAYSATQRFDEADAVFGRAMAMTPNDPNLPFGAGMACALAGRMEQASGYFEQTLRLDSSYPLAHYNLGLAQMKQGRIDDAALSYRRAIEINPGDFNAQLNLGLAMVRQGNIDEGLACFRRALKLRPGDDRAHYNIGLALLYADAPAEALFAWHRENARKWDALYPPESRDFGARREPGKRLKIGYVSPDFRRHSVAYFIEPVLENHDRSRFEVYCYFSHPGADEVSRRIQRSVDHWRPCHELTDDQLALQIEEDGIDILVDLAGHMNGNRLPVFNRRVAPLQLSYLGYPASTGLKTIDYRIVTMATDPPGQERWHSEQLYRLPRTLWCYRPPDSIPESGEVPPMVANGFATFGSMNNITKLSPRTVGAWAAILKRTGDARLVLTGIPEHAGRTSLVERFAAHGIDAQRLVIHGRLPAGEYRELLGSIDAALDPFPYNGTTTTCETLWAGVPVVSLIGETSVARSGYALLGSVGLAELAADDEEAYVETAVRLASDPDKLQELRHGLRQRVASSPLRDESGFTRDLESAYREMWQGWCDEINSGTPVGQEPAGLSPGRQA